MGTKQQKATLSLRGAVEADDLEAAQKAIRGGADVNDVPKGSLTPLMWAILEGHLETTALLIKKGADVNARFQDGSTALIMAACVGNPEVIAKLLEAGADVSAKDDDGIAACEWAKRTGHLEVVDILKKACCPTIHVGPDVPNSNSSFRKTFPFGNPNTYRFDPPAPSRSSEAAPVKVK